jgi:plasmid stabilization system protein ParE
MREIRWDKDALKQFNSAITYIRNDSPTNADKVKREFLSKIVGLGKNAEIHALDKYKKDNTGNYRAFELHRYRVSFKVNLSNVIITRVKHTSQEPKLY